MRFILRQQFTFWLAVSVCLFSLSLSASDKVDVRAVIDVSGSMKENDPENLRAPGMRMLSEIIPEESHAGIWTFARYVNMLVKWQAIDENWRQQARDKADDIHSHGLFTDIEDALATATGNIDEAANFDRRSVILLSDGLIDISDEQQVNVASQRRIIDEILPRLKKHEVTVHTIALSPMADRELLKTIALETGGWYEQVNNAHELQRVFLHLFEKASARDTLPLDDNQFSVDEHVRQMTVVVFRESDAESTTLMKPDGDELTPEDASDNLRWLHESGFDMITIDQPQRGEWQINAEIDPDNRVLVLTDLQLETNDLPNNTLIGESFDIEAYLTEQGTRIEKQDFLALVDANLTQQQTASGEKQRDSMEQRDNSGIFVHAAGKPFVPGRNDVIVRMETETFTRERRQSVNVVAMPFDVGLSQLTEAESRSHRLELKADEQLLIPDSIEIKALLRAEDGSEFAYAVPENGDNSWRLTIAELEPGENYQLSLQIRARTPAGRDVFLQPTPLMLEDEANLLSTQKSLSEALKADTAGSDVSGKDTEDAKEQGSESPQNNKGFEFSNMQIMLIGNALFMLLLLAGLGGWKYRQRQRVLPGEML